MSKPNPLIVNGVLFPNLTRANDARRALAEVREAAKVKANG